MDEIKQKLSEAPDESYEIGLVIGSFLPITLLIVITFLLYFYFKKEYHESN